MSYPDRITSAITGAGTETSHSNSAVHIGDQLEIMNARMKSLDTSKITKSQLKMIEQRELKQENEKKKRNFERL